MKSLHIFLITSVALSTLVIYSKEVQPTIFTALAISIIVIGGLTTIKSIKNGK